jgi:hypothetical protein
VGYNVQAAVDTKHHLIVEHDVTNVGNDHGQLSRMALSAKNAIGKPKLKVVADRGYFSEPEIRACDLNDISAYVPKPLTSASWKKGLFTKADFVYVAKSDLCSRASGDRPLPRKMLVSGRRSPALAELMDNISARLISVATLTISNINSGRQKTERSPPS